PGTEPSITRRAGGIEPSRLRHSDESERCASREREPPRSASTLPESAKVRLPWAAAERVRQCSRLSRPLDEPPSEVGRVLSAERLEATPASGRERQDWTAGSLRESLVAAAGPRLLKPSAPEEPRDVAPFPLALPPRTTVRPVAGSVSIRVDDSAETA